MNPNESLHADSAERTLVCVSSSPSDARIIRTAAKMAAGGEFAAVHVVTTAECQQSGEEIDRLQKNILLAQSLGAEIATVYGNDVACQIAEYARLSGVTAIVIGRSNRHPLLRNKAISEELAMLAPNLDIHIIPDGGYQSVYRDKPEPMLKRFVVTPGDLALMMAILSISVALGLAFQGGGLPLETILAVFFLSVLITARYTNGYGCGILSSLLAVVSYNFFFTEPQFSFSAYSAAYPFSLSIMLMTAVLTSTLTAKLKVQASRSAQASFRAKLLFDTDKLLQKTGEEQEIIRIAASQICILLDRSVIGYQEINGELDEGTVFLSATAPNEHIFRQAEEKRAANWTFANKNRSGASTQVLENNQCLYLAIRTDRNVYGVLGILLNKEQLDDFESGIIFSILGECALAIENRRILRQKEQAAQLAQNEQLRSNLLRSISHDLRTPLTSISGNAGNLLSSYGQMDEDTRKQIFQDIYDDSEWLISVVENLLSITRFEEGRMNLHPSLQQIDEILEEATHHISRKSVYHQISIEYPKELLLVKADAGLLVQVIINLVDNAIKYTPEGSHIVISAEKRGKSVAVSVSDDGDGIADAEKPFLFEMFYTGNCSVADSRRSLGLGLPLCRTIIRAHGGEMSVKDNLPHGAVFSFILPIEEVTEHE